MLGVTSQVGQIGVGAAVISALLPICKKLFYRVEAKYIASLKLRKYLRPLGLEWLLYFRRHLIWVRQTRVHRRRFVSRDVVAGLQSKRLVFTATSGRSGTAFVHQLFSLLPDVTSEHEAEPPFQTHLRQMDRGSIVARDFLLQYKLPHIADLPTSRYVDVSHPFCKGFVEPTLALGIRPNLLVLRREPRLVALSFLERYTVPERTFFGLEWLLSPRFARSMPLPGWRGMSDYQLVFWYALEIERRQREYTGMIRSVGGVVRETAAVDLADFERFAELSKDLGLLAPWADLALLKLRHAETCAIRWNKNEGPLWRYVGSIEQEEEEVWRKISQSDPGLRSFVEERYSKIAKPALSVERKKIV
jgi:hypothetical protein